jgi:5-methyltetrahydropteroyltriglutamate--homocysteine methyltransferase
MQPIPLRTTVIGSYPFPGWLELAAEQLDRFGPADLEELQEDAVTVAIQDQLRTGLDVITDGEQSRLDFNLSFYGFLEGIDLEQAPPRRFGPPAHDQRGRHQVIAPLAAPRGLGAVEEFERLQRLTRNLPGTDPGTSQDAGSGSSISQACSVPSRVTLKASVPGPYTLSGRLTPGGPYADRFEVAEGLLPLVRDELEKLVAAGCRELTVDEPSMSCYAYREDRRRFVDLFNRTVQPIVGKCRLSTHLCFGNFKGHAVAPRRYAPMFPDFLDLQVDEIHLEMAGREFAELELIREIARQTDVAVGIIDVKSYYVETIDEVARRVRSCLEFAPAERLAFAPDCGLSQTARWAAKQKLANLVAGVHAVRAELGLS